VTAAFLGWTLDAFDFFVVVFLLDVLPQAFDVTKAAIVGTLWVTLALRPVGAFVFGLLADRYGRRLPLMASIIFFSVVELLCGFAPSYTVFVVLRGLYGIGMGGEWGVGASLAMEHISPRWRGVISGFLQSGYSFGYLLAALASGTILPHLGWRPMFWIGGVPALLALYIRSSVPEPEAWRRHRATSFGEVLRAVWEQVGRFGYLAIFMALMMFLSHGTQDLYPDFLKSEHHLDAARVAQITIFYNLGAILGAIVFGQFSQRVGRRRSMLAAFGLSLLAIPLWVGGASPFTLVLGACLLQMGVQGAWGIVPAHLNELAPDRARGLVPGFAYQIGVFIAAPVNTLQYALRDHVGYAWALAGFEIVVILTLSGIVWFSAEAHGRSFLGKEDP
jgi:SHS family lactate transporter-like MFS transporter